MKTEQDNTKQTKQRKYTFEFGGIFNNVNVDFSITFDELELSTLIISGNYRMSIFISDTEGDERLTVELTEAKNLSCGDYVYYMYINGLKESFDFMYRFAGIENVAVYSDLNRGVINELKSIHSDLDYGRLNRIQNYERVDFGKKYERETKPKTHSKPSIIEPDDYGSELPF